MAVLRMRRALRKSPSESLVLASTSGWVEMTAVLGGAVLGSMVMATARAGFAGTGVSMTAERSMGRVVAAAAVSDGVVRSKGCGNVATGAGCVAGAAARGAGCVEGAA